MKDLTKQILSEIGYCTVILILIVFIIWTVLTSAAEHQYKTTSDRWAPPVGLFCDNAGNCRVEYRK